MSLLVSSEDFIQKVFLFWRVVHHDSIVEGDLIIRNHTSDVWPLFNTSIYELC